MDKIFLDFFYVLAQSPFDTSESELDYHHRKVKERVASQLAKQLKT